MAQQDISVLGLNTIPDGSGDVWVAPVNTELTLASAPGNELCVVLPASGSISTDTGIYGKFTVPQNYDGAPVLVIRGILNGAPSSEVIAFGVQMKPLADDEAYDAAFHTQDIASASSVSQADEDVYEENITLTNSGPFAISDDVDFFFYIDDSVHTYTGTFLLTGLFFRYTTT